MLTVDALSRKHMGETAWIVGKGPSLKHLRAEHIGEGIIIALNESIAKVDEVGFPHQKYALQRDACVEGRTHKEPDCTNCPGDIPQQGKSNRCVTPLDKTTVALIQRSERCLNQYEGPRILISPHIDLGLRLDWDYSVIVATALAWRMGCERIVYVCCDAIRTGIGSSGSTYYNPTTNKSADMGRPLYKDIARSLKDFMGTNDLETVIPMPE